MAWRAKADLGSPRHAALKDWIPSGLSALLAGVALVLLFSVQTPELPKNPLWLMLIVAFLVSESTLVHFEFRHQTVGWAVSEIPLVVGLLAFGPVPTILARGLAILIVLVLTGYKPSKIVFNVSVAVFEGAVAGWLLQLFGLSLLTEPIAWFSIIAILLFTSSLGIACIAAAILLTEGRISRHFWSTMALPQLFFSPTTATVGVVVLLLLEISPWAGLLAAVVLGLFVLLYRRYATAAQDRRSLAQVYEFSEKVKSSGSDSAGEVVILAAVREKFNAARAALLIPAYLDQGPRLLAVTEDGNDSYPGPDDADDVIRLGTTAAQGARLVAQGGRPTPGELRALHRRGVSELICVPLDTVTREPGYLEVCDRNGSVLQFSAADVELMESLATHVAGALRARQLSDKIRYDAAHDQVTDLPNRFWLTAAIDAYLAADRVHRRLALLVVEIDGFAQIKETLGHAAGDEFLQVIAASIAEHAPADATVARVGAAQFALVLHEVNVVQAEREAARLCRAVSDRVQVAGLQLSAELTVGVAVAPMHGSSADPLIQRADVAVVAARSAGQSSATYSPAMDEQSLRRLQLGAELPDALESPDLSVFFQPIVGAKAGEIAAIELLSRWTHPRLGPVSADEFIPLAERIGQITPLTRRVLNTGMQRCRTWLDEGVMISIAVNLSAQTLVEPGFVDEVADRLAMHRLPPKLLTFEITEGSVIGDALALPALDQLHELGVRLSIDDFGTGYSSLSYLCRLPIDEVKIDKSFVLGLSTDPGTNTIARSIIDLAHKLDLRVVAEGVEDELTRDLLTSMGCDFLQGYLVSRPLSEPNLGSWLTARTATRPVDQNRSQRKLYIIR